MEELDRLTSTREILVSDQVKQSEHCKRINEELSSEKNYWIAESCPNGSEIARDFLTQ